MLKARPFLLAPALALVGCGPMAEPGFAPDGETTLPIINGEACEPEEMDTAVAILVDAEVDFGFGGTTPIKTVVCTGTLIAPDVVMTAAHCLDASALTLGFGTVNREDYYITFEHDLAYLHEQEQGGEPPEFPEDAVKAVRKVAHESFTMDAFNEGVNGPGNFYDIGLLFLEETVDAVEPEVVITADEAAQLVVDAEVLIAGWGQQTQTDGPFDPPPEGTVGKKICATSFVAELGTHEMQIGNEPETSRKCHGDSGGPSYLEVETSHARSRRVVGITSHAYDESDCAKGGVDTRVDAWLDWFDAQMRAACTDGTRVWCEVEGIIPPSFYDPATEAPDAGVPGGDDDDDKKDDGVPPAQGCQCGESEGGDPAIAFAGLGLFASLLLRRRRKLR